MPKGPKGQKRPADVIGNAVRVMQIATGEVEEDTEADDGKDKAAQAMGRKGGAARAKKLTAEQRSEIARQAAAKRWNRTEE
ncbi:MAG: RNA-binding protein [Alphaproteobacteria bacterium]|nr:RNA-binding protein [Alphaproteobacteria bacterium]